MVFPTVSEFTNYKDYLNGYFKARDERGLKSKVAKAIGCDLGYVSRVLNGDAHFSLEQADALNSVLVHSSYDSRYFLLLVSKERAGTISLRKHFERLLEGQLQEKLSIKQRIQPARSLSEVDQARYYSSWQYAAVHLLLAIPEFQTPEAIQARLRIAPRRVHAILDFLVSAGLAVRKSSRFEITSLKVHLGNDSPFIAKHHTNWRLQAIDSLERENPFAIHYSSVVSVGKQDLPKVAEILIQAIESIRKTVSDSSDEVVWCYGLDWFPVIKS